MNIEFHEDHMVAEGKRWALSCDWRPWFVGQYFDIPPALIINPEARKAAWAAVKPPSAELTPAMTMAEWKKVRRKMLSPAQKEKNARGLARMKERHAGERYDRKKKMWVKK